MSSHEAFLADIIEHPDDDAPRLIYADWLEENGDPARAEFIRLQCRLAKEASAARRAAMEERAEELLEEHREEWAAAIDAIPGAGVGGWERGFPRNCCPSLKTMGRAAGRRMGALLALAPWRALYLNDVTARGLEHALSCSRLGNIRHLHLFGDRPLGPRCARLIAGCTQMANLVELEIADQLITDEGLAALASARHLARLKNLNVATSRITAAGVEALAGACFRLNELWIDENAIGPAGAALIAGSARFSELQVVHFSYCEIGPEGAAHLAASRHLVGLNTLDLYQNGLGDDGARALGDSRHLSPEEIHLQFNDIGPGGLAALARGRMFEEVRELLLIGNRIGPAGAAALAGSRRLKQLERLVMGDCHIGPEGGRRLGASRGLPRLRALYLRDNSLGDEGAVGLTAGPLLGSVRKLDLAANGLSDRAAVALAGCPALASLTELDLNRNRIGDEGAAALAASPHLGALTELSLLGNAVTDRGKRALHERFGEEVARVT